MRKSLFLLFCLLAGLMLGTAGVLGCDDDDDEGSGDSADADSDSDADGDSDSDSDSDTGQSAECPDMSGTWDAVEHCSPQGIGTFGTITQTGCDLVLENGITAEWTGSIDADGNVTMTGVAGGAGVWTCTGPLATDTVDLLCSPVDCAVKIVRQ